MKDRIVIWDEADEGQIAKLLCEITNGGLCVALEQFASTLDAVDDEARETTLARMSLITSEPALGAQDALNVSEFGALIGDALAANKRRRAQTFADRATGLAAAGLMSAAITEWAQRGGRTKLTRLLAEAVGILRIEFSAEANQPEKS